MATDRYQIAFEKGKEEISRRLIEKCQSKIREIKRLQVHPTGLYCKEFHPGTDKKIDLCLRCIIDLLNRQGIKTLASCCGHAKYPATIIIDVKGFPVDIFTRIRIPRKKRFYRLDEDGFYYIPEIVAFYSPSL